MNQHAITNAAQRCIICCKILIFLHQQFCAQRFISLFINIRQHTLLETLLKIVFNLEPALSRQLLIRDVRFTLINTTVYVKYSLMPIAGLIHTLSVKKIPKLL